MLAQPDFGAGLIEAIYDGAIVANLAANAAVKAQLGISGRTNSNGNDGTITKFGWKAQNKSLPLFSAEAYNVELGISNEPFQTEREANPACQFANVPNDATDRGDDHAGRRERAREVCLLPALPGTGDGVHDVTGRGRVDRPRLRPVPLHGLRALPHAVAPQRRLSGGRASTTSTSSASCRSKTC